MSEQDEKKDKKEKKEKKPKRARKRRGGFTNYRPWIKLLIRLLIIGVLALTIFLLVKNWRKIAPIAFLDWYDQTFGSVAKGEGYPYTIDGNTFVDMVEVDPHLVVLSESSVRFLTSDAACVVERSHPFADPTLHAAGEYVLITEIGGSRLQLETRRETVLSTAIENRKILAGDLLPDGTMAFVTNSSSLSYLSEIWVLNSEGEILYHHQTKKYLLCDIALSPNGDELTVVGTTADGGMLKSGTMTVTLDDGAIREKSGAEVLLHSVSYLSEDVILAIGDREIWTIVDEKLQKNRCEGLVPTGYTVTSSLACVAFRREGATNAGVIWMFDTKGVLVKEAAYTGALRSVTGRGENVVLLTDSSIYELTAAGIKEQNASPSDCLFAAYYGDKPLVLTFGELKRLQN